jgi:predicted type IV restriction endonuclease
MLDMMTLKEALEAIKAQLPQWERQGGLNEAQTSQAIVLRILHALYYDIWNPLEVFPQETSNSGIPDYIVSVGGKRRFVLEIKKLGYLIDAKSKTQAVSYANNQAIRWAILTNGIDWLLFDSFQFQPAHERLVLALSFQNHELQQLVQHFSTLLHRDVWKQAEADANVERAAREIRDHLELYRQLEPVARKLEEIMSEYTAQDPMAGLKLANDLGRWTDEEKALIANHRSLILDLLNPLHPTPKPPTPVLDALRHGITTTKPPLRTATKAEVKIKLEGADLAASSWRDLHAGIAEAFLLLGMTDALEEHDHVYHRTDERRKGDGSPYPKHGYRQLSNGKYLFLHMGAKAHLARSRRLLEVLGITKGAVEVVYKGQSYALP